MLVSIVLPTLREDAIAASLDALTACVACLEPSFEVIVVDDSAELFKEQIRTYISNAGTKRHALRLVDGPMCGKGAALRAGVLASRGDVVFTMDADLPVPLENIQVFLEKLDEGFDVVIGERPFNRNVSQPLRFVASRALYVLQVLVFDALAFDDTQCGFKAFRGSLVRAIASVQIVDGGMVDIEYLYAAGRARARVARVPVSPQPDARPTKINVKRSMLQDPIDLLRIRWGGLRGRYRAIKTSPP